MEYFLFRCVAGHRVRSSTRQTICTAALLKDGRPDVMYQPYNGIPERICGSLLQEIEEEEENEYYSER